MAIPLLAAALRERNEREAAASLKQIGSVQVTFKTCDSSSDALNEYWTEDVAGLYYHVPSGGTLPIRLIDAEFALADGNTATPYLQHVSSPKSGYWFQVMLGYEAEDGTRFDYGPRNTDRFSFMAYPKTYGSSGRLAFVLSEGGTMVKHDYGSDAWLVAPKGGVQDTDGVLKPEHGYFPDNPSKD